MMCEQTGQEIDWEKCPPELQDFPNIVIEAIIETQIYIFFFEHKKYNSGELYFLSIMLQ